MIVRKTMCESCIFREGSNLADRVEVLEDEWRIRDTHQICHDSAIGDGEGELYDAETGEDVDPMDAKVCRGFYENVYLEEGTGQMIRISERLGLLTFDD